ncbi:Wadjet anti-phage system protein JetD domain-containing protein [Microbulbifer epialgicus]|uniref:Wadjet anti-phage system protein JetD domain-containing protein n=1 Tax=Microbulbifer epialgicus TaxID=393907 RepID=A0ABV4P4R3_9GAMM
MNKLDQIRNALSEGNKSTAQGDKLVERLQKKSKLDRSDVIKGLSELKDSDEVQCDSWLRGEPIGRVRLNIVRPRSESELRWESVLVGNEASINDIEALLGMSEQLADLCDSDLNHLYHGLCQLRTDFPKLKGESRYIVSSRYLLGSSKILDALPSQCLRNFGIDLSTLSGPPSYVITAGPQDPECVVLVENPQALESAIGVEGCERIAWVATYGYGLSRSGDEYGRQLASIVEQGNGLKSLVRSGNPPDVLELLTHPRIYFWGDLDREGLKIFWRLKSSIPHLQLSAIYHAMYLKLLSSQSSHPYVQIAGKENQATWECNNRGVEEILYACAQRAVDQESVTEKAIQVFSGKPLSSVK